MAPGMEQFNNEPTTAFSSRTELAIDKLQKKIAFESLTEDQALAELAANKRLIIPGVTVEDILSELKKNGMLAAIQPKLIQEEPKIEHVETRYQKLEGVKEVNDPELLRKLEENEFMRELERRVFKTGELDVIYEKAIALEKDHTGETEEYYFEFAQAGLLKGGIEEAKTDLKALAERQAEFEAKNKTTDGKPSTIERAKKIATIIERGIGYSVSELGWYGKNVSIEPTSQFDDVKRSVDEVLEIKKQDEESSFMGLGIDVTYRGLLSEKYKDKFFKLLTSIRDGHKTKIKYFKNHAGEKMREFSVPKIILFFNIDDVASIARLIQNLNDPKVRAEFENSPQKFAVLNQIVIECEQLSLFAEEHKNDIFKKYTEVLSSIKELAWENEDVKKILDARHEDEVSKHMQYLIKEFKDTQLTEAA